MNEIERRPLNSELLRSFVAIADCASLTAAAGRLNRTQSAVSVQLRKLEEDLGVPLFERTARGMALNEAGERLLPRARSILTELRQAGALFQTPLTGRLRIGIPDDFEEAILEEALTAFARRHPGVDVMAKSGCTSTYPEAIRTGALDIAVYSGPDNQLGEEIGVDAVIWAAGLRQGGCRSPGLDAPVPLAVLDRGCWWRDLPTAALERAGRPYRVAFRSASFGSLRTAIRAGFAVGILPEACLTENMRVLAARDGFPPLPASRRSILTSPAAPPDLAAAMAECLKDARD